MKLFITISLAAMAVATNLLVPLYQYPLNKGQAWASIEQALSSNLNLNSTLVINANDGPGKTSKEGINDTEYVDGTAAISRHPNAHMIGYIHTSTNGGTTRCNRPYSELETDIRTWPSWVTAGIPIRGIFIDEAALHLDNTNNPNCLEYMRNLTNFIQNDPSLKFPSPRLLIFNAGGTGTLQPFYDLNLTYIIALETCFVVPAKTGGSYDQCDPGSPNCERYDHDGYGSSIENVLFPSIG